MSLTACAQLVERADPTRFRSIMAAPVGSRRVLFAIHAFNVEVARAPWVTQEAMIAEMRLQWWRDALEEIGSADQPRRHDVVDGLAEILDTQGAEALDGLVAARRWDIYKDSFEGPGHFEEYINSTSGNLMWTAARLLGYADERVVRDFAYAVGIANLLRAAPELEARGRRPFVDGRPEALRQLSQAALDRLEQARASRRLVSRSASPALLSGFLARPVLELAVRSPSRIAEGALQFSPHKESWRLAMASLRGWWV